MTSNLAASLRNPSIPGNGPMTTTTLIEAGFAQHRAGRLDLAEALYRQVLGVDADNLNALQLLGALAFDAGRLAESTAFLERAATVLDQRGTATAQHAVLYVNLGNSLRGVGRNGDAIACYRRGLSLAPELAELHAGLAAALKIQGDLPAAVAGYETALRLAGDRPDWLHNLASTQIMAGQVDAAIALYRRTLKLAPERPDTLHGLALALMSQARPDEAIELLNRLAIVQPNDPTIHSALGNAQFAAKQLEPALRSFERVLALRPDDADAFYAIGRIRHGREQHDEAEAAYRHALRLRPAFAGALFNLGLLLYRREQIQEAIALFEQVVAVAPDHADVHCALGNAWRSLMRFDHAIAAYRRHLERTPGAALSHLLLGETLSEDGQKEAALPYLEKSITLAEDKALIHLAHVDLGGALQALGRVEEALGHFRCALALAPLVTHPAATAKAEFSALLVMAPGASNTPYEYLIDGVDYDAHVLILLPDTIYDLAMLAARCDVVVNLVSDVDQAQGMLPVAAALIDPLEKPTINHPRKIASTSREAISTLLAGIPCCRVAEIRRHPGVALMAPDFLHRPDIPKLPFLARLAGRHGGDEFEMIASASDLQRLVARHPDEDYYLIEYLDYRSQDGFFRKYRFFYAGTAILPYHLAISTEWKIHHFRTDMGNHAWMQAEEGGFLRAPERVFNPAQFAALRAIREAVGLDFFGIDCGLDRAGNLVVFEANATMLVHGRNPEFPYKTPAARQIKTAFAAMLAKAASTQNMNR